MDIIPQDTPMKQCNTCNRIYPATADYFHRFKTRPDGLHNFCKSCSSEKRKKYHAEHKAQAKAYAQEYRKKNADKVRERKKAYNAAHKEEISAWSKEYRFIHRDHIKQRSHEYNMTHRELIRARDQRYVATHREKVKVKWRNHSARRKAASGTHTKQDIQVQYERQRKKCYYCQGKLGKSYHVDHVVPLARGGSNGPENLVIACITCNQRKHAKLLHEWPEGGRLL